MEKRLQGLIAGVLIGAMLTSGVVFAKNIQETIDAVYMNVKLVIDGEEITPKDGNGNIVEPFIYNGTTYLPIRAIGEAFHKDVHWDGETATVYVGDIVKPAKEVYLYDKPYLECESPSDFMAGNNETINAANPKLELNKYIGYKSGRGEYIDNGYSHYNSVTYSLNGLAKKAKGTFVPPAYNAGGCDFAEFQVKFYNESGKLLYQSPKMTTFTSPISFEFETGKALKLKIEFSGYTNDWTYDSYCAINDFAILTTDY